jgi:hypothetical protein
MDGGYEISSASDDEPMRKLYLLLAPGLFYFFESLPTYKGSDSSESKNGGGENILIESSTVLNSEKEFSKFDKIDRESHHLLGGPTDRSSWAGRPCHRTFLLAKNPLLIESGQIQFIGK